MDLEQFYQRWVASGSPGDDNNSVPCEIKWYYLYRTIRDYDRVFLVESGTSHGDTVANLMEYVDHIWTIEAWNEAFYFSQDRFKGMNKVDVLFGDSAEVLPKVLEKIDAPAVFWLDAHYSGDGTAKLDKQTPIVAELEAIAAHNQPGDCIVIDDARGFGVWADYPPVEVMEQMSKDLFPNHTFSVEGDELFILP